MAGNRLTWRSPLPVEGEGFAEWVRALKRDNASGSYTIRDARTRKVLYVGESHTGRLYSTMTRHLQQWNGEGSGPSYGRAGVEVAVRILPRDLVENDQYDLIERLRPRDNRQDGHTLREVRLAERKPKKGKRRRVDDDLSDIPF